MWALTYGIDHWIPAKLKLKDRFTAKLMDYSTAKLQDRLAQEPLNH